MFEVLLNLPCPFNSNTPYFYSDDLHIHLFPGLTFSMRFVPGRILIYQNFAETSTKHLDLSA